MEKCAHCQTFKNPGSLLATGWGLLCSACHRILNTNIYHGAR